jgi:hypothetical protein
LENHNGGVEKNVKVKENVNLEDESEMNNGNKDNYQNEMKEER